MVMSLAVDCMDIEFPIHNIILCSIWNFSLCLFDLLVKITYRFVFSFQLKALFL